MHPKFIADVHLGKLARLLRMLGFDTAFENGLPRAEWLRMARETKRIVLTRDRKLAQNPFFTVLVIESEKPEVQLCQVMRHFDLRLQHAPFSLCLVCNTLLHPVPKTLIEKRLEPETRKAFHEFWQCPHCGRIYWKGSHYERMQQMIRDISQS